MIDNFLRSKNLVVKINIIRKNSWKPLFFFWKPLFKGKKMRSNNEGEEVFIYLF